MIRIDSSYLIQIFVLIVLLLVQIVVSKISTKYDKLIEKDNKPNGYSEVIQPYNSIFLKDNSLCSIGIYNSIIIKNKMDKISKDDIRKELEIMMFEKELIDISLYFCNSTDEAVDMIARMMEDDKYKKEMKNLSESGKNNSNKIDGNFIDNLLKNKIQYKMTIVVRKDINMSSGKMAAQVAHAAVNCYKKALKKTPDYVNNWEYIGEAKIVLMVNSLKEFNSIEDKAKKNNINYAIIQDAGRTELEPGTVTTIAIGPAPVDEIDKITGDLSLYKD